MSSYTGVSDFLHIQCRLFVVTLTHPTGNCYYILFKS